MRSEPKHIDLIWSHKRDQIHDYNVTVAEWSDDSYTILASKPGLYEISDIIIEHDITWDTFPSDEEIEQIITERLHERVGL